MKLALRISCFFLAIAAAWQHWIWPAMGAVGLFVYISIQHYEQEIDELIAVEEEEE